MAMRPLGLLLVAAALAVPIPWFAALAGQHDPIALLSQYFGSAALIVMAISQLLATRFRVLEVIFGGLDRIYVLHKWLGISALAFILLHDTIDAEMDGLGAETLLVEVAETFGEISLYGILALVVITIATFVPYHLWRLTHRFIGGFYAASAFHFAFILKPFALTDPAGLYVLAFCVIGILSYLYTLLISGRLANAHDYVVDSVGRAGDALAVTLAPAGRGMRQAPGQFAFVRFDAPGFTEPHPFTISQGPADDRRIRFTIKPLGDFTDVLGSALKSGAKAKVAGPYGRFQRKSGGGPEVWIAAGIGVTPFVAWAEALEADAPPVWLFYCIKSRENAAHLDTLEAIAAANADFNLVLVESGKAPRLTAATIAQSINAPVSEISAAFCGPKPMRETLQRDFQALGLRRSRFHFEEFEIRSGIGLRLMLAWFLKRIRK
jgi:predicted ferric reductase